MKNEIIDLRNHLFAALESLADPDKPMPIDRAQAIAEVAQVIVNSAKVEVDYLRFTDGGRNGVGTGFINKPSLPPVPDIKRIK